GLSEQIRRLVFSLEERQREVPPSLAAKSSAHGKVCPTPPNEGKPVRWPNAVSGHVTSFCREIRGFLTWPWSIWPSEVAAEERRNVLVYALFPDNAGTCGQQGASGHAYIRVPPSTTKTWPVTYAEASDARKSAAPTMSAGWACRPSGV